MGVTAQPITPELQEVLGLKDRLGALISDIEPGSSAANAGIKSGDVIMEYDGIKIKTLFHLRNLVGRTKVGSKVELLVIRDGKELILNTTIVEMQKEGMKGKKDFSENLGIIVQTLTSKLALNLGYKGEKGVIIASIKANSPAFKAELKAGDLIVEAQHKAVENIDDFYKIASSVQPGDDILLLIKHRDGTSKFVVIEVGGEE